jgi:hypothetical protein
MRRTNSIALIALTVLIAACSEDGGDPVVSILPGDGAPTAIEAVEGLVGAINSADFVASSRLAIPGHAALASLAEGATFSAVADALREGDEEVAANFWAGFAQGSGAFLTETLTTAEGGVVDQDALQFHTIMVRGGAGEERAILVRDDDGFRVDLFASFGAGLADKMAAPVERLLTTQTDDARLILASLANIVPSLLVAAELPGTTPEVAQQILALVELITRVG